MKLVAEHIAGPQILPEVFNVFFKCLNLSSQKEAERQFKTADGDAVLSRRAVAKHSSASSSGKDIAASEN